MKCTLCDEPATTRCRRCDAPVCGFHGPYKADLACRTCEDLWDRSRTRRRIATAPAALIGFSSGLLILFGVFYLLDRSNRELTGGPFAVVAIFLPPIALALACARWAERRLRRRFLVRTPASPSGRS